MLYTEDSPYLELVWSDKVGNANAVAKFRQPEGRRCGIRCVTG